MKSFLTILSEDIIKRYGNNLSRTVIVFPNKRAALFLNEELVKTAAATIWSPRYITISELFRKQSQLVVADHIRLVCELYRVYADISGSSESLDEFYSWGELLLSDFDDVDKNMADARLVFENTKELHEYDTADFLDEEQRKALKRFFSNFTDDQESRLKKNFEMLWNKLGLIYTTYRERLRSQGIAYEGMLYRDVVEQKSLVSADADRYLFVGFNLVQKVEQQLFMLLEEQKEVLYYWDHDEYYLNNEAGKNIKEYLQRFPNALNDDELHPVRSSSAASLCNDNENENRVLAHSSSLPLRGRAGGEAPSITFINAATEDIQARYVSEWLTPERIEAGKRTAIVLCNEALLPTVVNCLPPEVSHVNITTGYPLANTPSATFIRQFFNLYRIGTSGDGGHLRLHIVNNMLRHPYMQYISPLHAELMTTLNEQHIFFPTVEQLCLDDNLRLLFSPITAPTAAEANILIADRLMHLFKIISQAAKHDPLTQETLFRTYTLLSRIRAIFDVSENEDQPHNPTPNTQHPTPNTQFSVDTITFQNLILQAIRTTTVPFHGEPVIGVQIMGVLETRNLDFDHLLILSCNEGNLPKGVNDASFIPHTIRRAYSLTTVENKVGIYAYYFYRLLQRATDIQIAYNSATEDGQTGEKSRFMSQLLAESPHPINLRTLNAPLQTSIHHRHDIEKDELVIQKLNSMTRLSPSAINTYLRCPLQFFYKTVCGIKDENEDEDDIALNNRIFGLIFHDAMETLYKPFVGKQVTESMLDTLIKDEHTLDHAIERAFKINLFKFDEATADDRRMPRLDGSQVVQRNVIKRLIRNVLRYDKRNAPIFISALEKHIELTIPHPLESEERRVKREECLTPRPSTNLLPKGKSGGSLLTLHGYIDRLDIAKAPDGTQQKRIIDYKTSNAKQPSLPSVADIFNPANISKHSDYYLQTILYCLIEKKNDEGNGNQNENENKNENHPVRSSSAASLCNENENENRVLAHSSSLPSRGKSKTSSVFEYVEAGGEAYSPCLLYPSHALSNGYTPTLTFGERNSKAPITDIADIAEEFEQSLNDLIAKIFSPDEPFSPTPHIDRCEKCYFANICGSRG